MKVLKTLQRLVRNCRGATSIEYGLIVALVVLAMLAALRGVADENTGLWARIKADVLAATQGAV